MAGRKRHEVELDKPARGSATKRERVWHVVTLMASGAYERGVTDKELAVEWNMPEVSVRGITAEASRTVGFVANDREQVLNLVKARLLEIAVQDEADRVPAMRTLLEHMGELRQVTKSQVAITQLPDDYEERLVEAVQQLQEMKRANQTLPIDSTGSSAGVRLLSDSHRGKLRD